LEPVSLVGNIVVLVPSVFFLGLSLKLNGLYDCPRERGGRGVALGSKVVMKADKPNQAASLTDCISLR